MAGIIDYLSRNFHWIFVLLLLPFSLLFEFVLWFQFKIATIFRASIDHETKVRYNILHFCVIV